MNKKETLFAKNVNTQVQPASLTKVMTALVALKYGSLDQVLVAGSDVYVNESGAQKIGLKEGDRLTLTITPPDDSKGLLPKEREITVKFRDLIYPDVTVTLGDKPCVIELSDLAHAKNESRDELKNAILTRVQGSNSRKNRYYGKRLPTFIKDALSEIDNLHYT